MKSLCRCQKSEILQYSSKDEKILSLILENAKKDTEEYLNYVRLKLKRKEVVRAKLQSLIVKIKELHKTPEN